MLPWVPRAVVFFLTLCVACGTDADGPVDPGESEAAEPAEGPADGPADDPDNEDFLEDEAPQANVDEMDEHALEAACFAGQQAACDQLGH
ncbi:MAG: hypothetical protein AB8H86_23145 [Polyangiales bacterium]